MKWSEKYVLGNKEVDEQHEKLVGIINKLADAILLDKGDLEGEILDELVRYTRYHFGCEENLFRKHPSVNTSEHLESHKKFREKVQAQIIAFAKEDPERQKRLSKLLTYLNDWLKDHILGQDKDFLDQLK